MRTVWKFPLLVGKYARVSAGPGKVVLAAIDPASGAPAVWIEQMLEALPMARPGETVAVALDPLPTRTFIVVGTGKEAEDDWTHVGSMVDRSYVWHVYERAER